MVVATNISKRVKSILKNSRTSLAITFSVWKALLLREAVYRVSTGRAGWLWLIVEPALGILVLVTIYSSEQMHTIGGLDITIWVLVGQGAYYTYNRTQMQAWNAVNANQALFAYRQVKPVDTVLVRAILEGALMTLVMIALCVGIGLLGHDTIPADPLFALVGFGGAWLVGLGVGLITSVLSELVPEIGKLIPLTVLPLHVLSGVLFNVTIVPQPYYDWLLFNPLVHSLETARLAFAPNYKPIPELSISYPFTFSLVTIFIGLALHVRFAGRIVAQ